MTQTPAMLVGSAVHCLVLEGVQAFDRQYIEAPEGIDRRTKEGKLAWAEFQEKATGREILTADQYDQVCQMWKSVMAHPTAGKLLAMADQRELSATWTDTTGIDCKARIDAYSEEHGLVVDLKTTAEADPKTFGRTIANFQYHGQASFYMQAMKKNDLPARQFIFICVEKVPPYAVACYILDDEALMAGNQLVDGYLSRHAECVAADNFPGYPAEVQTITLPAWA
jgi:exodeoxyribonuclease VIII